MDALLCSLCPLIAAMFSAPQVWDELKPVKCQNPAEAPCGNSGLFWWANLSYDIGELKLVHQ